MSTKDKIKRFKHLLYKHPHSFYGGYTKQWVLDCLEEIKLLENPTKDWVLKLKELKEIFDLSEQLGMIEKELYKFWEKVSIQKRENKQQYNLKPLQEKKDNKHVRVGSGNSQGPIRYPSKKRSRATWKRFYKLFPYLAEQDKWDGKTSSKMK